MAASAAKRDNETSEETDKASIPPAGGSVEARIGRDVINFLRESGYVVNENKKDRSWTDKFLDEAIPAAVAVGAIVVGYAGVTLVRTRLGEKRSKAVIETTGTATPQIEMTAPSSRRAS